MVSLAQVSFSCEPSSRAVSTTTSCVVVLVRTQRRARKSFRGCSCPHQINEHDQKTPAATKILDSSRRRGYSSRRSSFAAVLADPSRLLPLVGCLVSFRRGTVDRYVLLAARLVEKPLTQPFVSQAPSSRWSRSRPSNAPPIRIVQTSSCSQTAASRPFSRGRGCRDLRDQQTHQ